MALVSGYSSDSSSDVESNINDAKVGIKRQHQPSKQETKFLKKKRKGDDPWAKWDSSDEETNDAAYTLPEDDSSVKLILNNQNDNENLTEEDVISENEMNSETETSTFFDNKYYTNKDLVKPNVKGREFKKDATSIKCFMPKKILHSFKGHQGGTNDIQFFPKTAHLFLSCGNDKTIRLWDMYHDRSLLREYKGGHTQAIRRLDFDNSGKRFLSCSYERSVRLWDTESGKVIHKFQLPSPATTVKFNPAVDDEFLVGLNNSEIKHFDIRSSSCVQTYDHHLSSILDLNFFPDGSKFISSSEDKTVRLWKTGINITIKHISDIKQYAMPFIRIHPKNKVFLTQSMDNIIRTYEMTPKYKLQKKTFTGHHCAGHSIGFSLSPDGKYVVSGDSKGKMLVWDWNTSKVIKSIQVDKAQKPINTIAWSPQETSKVLCSGSVGKIYLYD